MKRKLTGMSHIDGLIRNQKERYKQEAREAWDQGVEVTKESWDKRPHMQVPDIMSLPVDQIIREAISDGKVSDEEVAKLIKRYDEIRFHGDTELKEWLKQHGYDIKISPPYDIEIHSPNRMEILDTRSIKMRDIKERLAESQRDTKRARILSGQLNRELNKTRDELEALMESPKKRRSLPTPQITTHRIGNLRMSPQKKQRLVWLAIVGTSVGIVLLLLL